MNCPNCGTSDQSRDWIEGEAFEFLGQFNASIGSGYDQHSNQRSLNMCTECGVVFSPEHARSYTGKPATLRYRKLLARQPKVRR